VVWTGNLHTAYDPAGLHGGYFVSHATWWQHAVNAYYFSYIVAAAFTALHSGRRSARDADRRQVFRFLLRSAAPAAFWAASQMAV